MVINPVGWFEIYVNEMPRAKTFYSQVFGFEFEDMSKPDMEMWAFPMDHQIYGAGGALVKMSGIEPGGNGVLIYFSCEDCAVQAEQSVQNGGKLVTEKQSIGEHGFFALVADTEGNTIGLHSMK